MARNAIRGATVTAWALVILAGQAPAQCTDPFDSTLCVYRLPPADSMSFSTTDGQVSAFWADWVGRDSIELTSERNCCRANSACACVRSDNRLVVKAACDASGLYLLVLVEDSVMLDRSNSSDWGTDAVDMYFDALSSTVLDTCTGCLIGLYETSLAYTTFENQTWLGHATAVGVSRLGGFCSRYWGLGETCTCAWGQCAPPCGFSQDVVALDTFHMAAEYYVPWWWYSYNACDALPSDLAGKRLAFMVGYNDRDSATDTVTCLRWQHGDPWTAREPGESHWGDLLLPQDLVPLGSAGHPVRALHSTKARAPVARFDLSGKRIRAGFTAHGIHMVESAAGHGTAARINLTASPR